MLTNILIISAIVFLIICIWGWYSSSLVLNVSGLPAEIDPAELGLDYERVNFTTEDGLRIDGLFVPAKGSTVTVIVCHGWGANKEDIMPSTKFLNSMPGVSLLYFDFRKHGKSEGEISTLGYKEMLDLKAGIEFLEREKREHSKKIGLLGFSMGASVALMTASIDKRISVVVADSPFSSMPDAVARYARLYYGFPKFPMVDIALLFTRLRLGVDLNDFSPVKFISKISPRPVFIIQGGKDLRMPVKEGRVLFEKAGEPKYLWIAEKAEHMTAYYEYTQEYQAKVGDFFNKYLKS